MGTKLVTYSSITALTYYELRLDSSKIIICVRTLSARHVTISDKTTIASFSAANIVPPILAPKIKTN